MRLFLTLLASFSLVFSPIAIAEDAVYIEAGDPAPFSGTLLTNEDAASLLVQIRTCGEREVADIQAELERAQSLCEFEKSMLQIDLDSQKNRYEIIMQSQDAQLDYILKSKHPRLSREATFIIGIVSGVVLTSAAAYSINLVSNTN